ncbi:glycerophosphodiester phosphodiesterase family protein [Xenorhabdus sp. PR6a]|uniref:glycerophosphodiester phosphodiesterase family protein n=1 Tax=Xenorhabdus sp. PR6a TaxID=3025877 RepID=UPI002359CF19|nr:glycerophosphodiester phosphodiesterase family protein [Xenorhabdus sp. PR6a]MDC9583135.1 glycerophosphodiester phosphodiesterase family protein [Xenorhabdus sp. PR6a]
MSTSLTGYRSLMPTLKILLVFSLVGAFMTEARAEPTPDSPYRTQVWDNKFIYGAYSSLISSYIMGTEFRDLIAQLGQPDNINQHEVRKRLADFQKRYANLTDREIRAILAFARANRSLTIYEEERSVITTDAQNRVFIQAMKSHPELRPVDDILSADGGFTSTNFQFNAHRALYNNALRIPQNSLAAIVNAYVAGIRSVEFDVLDTADHQSVVVHDLVTNRLTGDLNKPPVLVGKNNYAKIAQTNIDILNPLGAPYAVQSSGLKRLMKTEDVLKFIHENLPGMTVYIDARNDAPLSVIDILKAHPDYRDQVVIKVYPFAFRAGAYDVVRQYAARHALSPNEAAAEIYKINPHLLVVMENAILLTNEGVMLSTMTDMTFTMYWTAQEPMTSHYRYRSLLPFSTVSQDPANTFQGKTIFSDDQLTEIESRTYLLYCWATDFATLGDLTVFQIGITPSLEHIVRHPGDPSSSKEFNAMPQNDKFKSAIQDNFMALYKAIMAGTITPKLELPDQTSARVSSLIAKSIFGLSDRYPDFSLAHRTPDGAVAQGSIRNFYYNMGGTVYENNAYPAPLLRSSRAILNKQQELTADHLPVGYATTDLPTDLRVGAMGLLGHNGLPDDLQYRASALVKPRFTPDDIPAYTLPDWTKHLYGDAIGTKLSTFEEQVNDIKNIDGIIAGLKGEQLSMKTAESVTPPVPVINPRVLHRLAKHQPVYRSQVPVEIWVAAGKKIQAGLDRATVDASNARKRFQATFGTPYIE